MWESMRGAANLLIRALLLTPLLGGGAAQGRGLPGDEIGRFAFLGATTPSAGWQAAHPQDRRTLFLIDSASGEIRVCGDSQFDCTSIADSERAPGETRPHRFVGLEIVDADKGWKSKHPRDDHLVYTMDTATGAVQICGDADGACVERRGTPVHPPTGVRIVLLYRRADSAAITGRIYDSLVARYGAPAVFMDVYDVPVGADWRASVNDASANGSVILAVVGPRWKGPEGRGRIGDTRDPVRSELEAALAGSVPIVPVLVDGATMPREADLPVSIKAFADLNAATVDSGRDFFKHVSALEAAIDRILTERRATSGKATGR